MKKIAVFAGTFDPFTLGHQYVAEKAAKLFDELYVVIGKSTKTPHFKDQKRIELLKFNLMHLKNVKIDNIGDDLLGNFANRVGAKYLIKGIRSNMDFDYEKISQRVMEDSFPDLETVYVISPREHEHASSTLIRGFLNFDEKEKLVSPYISNITNYALFKTSSRSMDYEILYLKNCWDDLYIKSKRTSSLKKKLWDDMFFELINLYTEKGRYYHTINHLVACLEMADNLDGFYLEMGLALFFHDAIYNPHRNDNEDRSINLADEFLKKVGLNLEVRRKVRKLILATKHDGLAETHEEKLIADIDLAIFSDNSAFPQYERDIRKEYSFVPEEKYAEVRIKILQKFLDRKIYYNRYDEKNVRINFSVAYRNLQNSIEKLKEILKKK